MELKFKLDEEFDEKSPDGRDVKAKVTKEGDSFISIQNAVKEGEKSTKIVREFKGDEVIQTSTIIGCDLIPPTAQDMDLRNAAQKQENNFLCFLYFFPITF